jgi:hypothetical protein
LGPEIFTPENARAFGEFLGRRYREQPIVWILGGDRPIENDQHLLILRAMADGIRGGDRGRHLMGMHTWGQHSSSEYVHDEPWLDLHMLQSGHGRNSANWQQIELDYRLTPVRPVLDAEPGYEDSPEGIVNLDGGYLDDYDVRKALYWSLFAGAHGHTYGCWPIWCMWRPGLPPTLARRPWYAALHLPGASQVHHARDLLLSRPFLDRIPDQSLIVSDIGVGTYHLQATRDRNGRYAMVYIPAIAGRPTVAANSIPTTIELDLRSLNGPDLLAWWFDPRTGVAQSAGMVTTSERARFAPPAGGPDWILVVDAATEDFLPPGTGVSTA